MKTSLLCRVRPVASDGTESSVTQVARDHNSRATRDATGTSGRRGRLEGGLEVEEALVVDEPHGVGLLVQFDPLDPLDRHPAEARLEADVAARFLARAIGAVADPAHIVDVDAIVEQAGPHVEVLRRLPARVELGQLVDPGEYR